MANDRAPSDPKSTAAASGGTETLSGPSIGGRLSPDRFGASMPVDAPYYQSPPFYYRNARALTVAYETDADAAAELLPAGIELPLPAQALLLVLHYPTTTLGPYNEAILGIQCSWEGIPHLYIPHIVVDTVPPLAAGREIWGYPKKMAQIALTDREELVCGTVERPAGVRLVTATLRPEQPVEEDEAQGGGSLSLRVIPGVEAGAPPSLAELVRVETTDHRTHETWAGPATLSFDAGSALDPWHALPVRAILGGTLRRYDFTLPHGQVVRTY